MRSSVTGKRCVLEFDSVSDLVESVKGSEGWYARDRGMAGRAEFHGGVSSMDELARVAKAGLSAEGIEAYKIAEDRVQVMDRELPLPGFTTFYDVSGADVDVAAFLSGEPECMINYAMVDTPRVGRVITLVVSVTVASMITAETIRERGRAIMELIFAIERIGFQVELWADLLDEGTHGKTGRVKVKVKGAGEVLDAGEVMFAFTHPGMLRGLVLAAMHLFPASFHKALSIGVTYGGVVFEPDLNEYPEGAFVIPPPPNNDHPVGFVEDALRSLGLVD